MTQSVQRLEDALLVVRFQDGDETAFRLLFDRHNPRFLAYARRYMGGKGGASDAVQETWLAIARRIRRLDDPALFRAWGYRILTNKCVDWGRKMQSDRTMNEVMALENATSAANSNHPMEDRLTVKALMRRLPADRQALMSLFYVEGLTVGELANIFDIPAGTVKSRLHNTREALKQDYQRREP